MHLPTLDPANDDENDNGDENDDTLEAFPIGRVGRSHRERNHAGRLGRRGLPPCHIDIKGSASLVTIIIRISTIIILTINIRIVMSLNYHGRLE